MKQTNKQELIPLSVPEIRGNEWKYIKECLDTGWVSSVGSYVSRFEDELADYTGHKYAVAMTSGTSAIHIALLIAGVKPEDEVIVPTLTFVSPVNCVRYTGATPLFIDAEPDYLQIDVNKLTDFCKLECSFKNGELRNKKTGRRISAIIPVDLLGHPVDMDPVIELAEKYNIRIIEDATESLGAKYKGEHVGSKSDMACFSFNGNKIITTGGGGMLVTNNAQFAEKARYLSQQAKDDPVEYIHNEVGYNYRLTNVQAAIGCGQLENLNSYIEKKINIAELYNQELGDLPGITIPKSAKYAEPTYWLYTILVNKQQYGITSRELMKKLQDSNIQTRPLWHPIHSLKPYTQFDAYNIEKALILYQDALSLPCSVNLSRENQMRVVGAIVSH